VSLTYSGWGTFTIPISIYFKPESGRADEPIHLDHELVFEEGEHFKTVSVKFKKKYLKNLLSKNYNPFEIKRLQMMEQKAKDGIKKLMRAYETVPL